MTETAPPLLLKDALDFADLYDDQGLVKLDRAFLHFLGSADPALAASLTAARAAPDLLATVAESELLLTLAPHLDAFVARLFGIEPELKAAADRRHQLAPLYTCRRLFVQRRAAKAFTAEEASTFDGPALAESLAARLGRPLDSLASRRRSSPGWRTRQLTRQISISPAATPPGRC